MKILKSAPFLFLSALLATGLNIPASANDNGEVKIISRQIDRNLERVNARREGSRAIFKNNFRPVGHSKRQYNEGPIFGDNDCTKRTCGGAMFGPQTCKKIEIPCEDCQQSKPSKPKPHLQNYVTLEEDIFQAIHHRCGDFAPLQLEWVDFRIKKGRDRSYSRNLGNYRFRIFGCRRDQRHAILNEGRILQKNMEFIRIFEDKVSDCYNIVKIPNDLCLNKSNKPLPEYILTAEITDYFMNLCDEFDWDNVKKANLRTGSAQMTITWRLMDLSKSNVLWKGETNGYSEVPEGEYNAEMILIERAFADAVDNLRQLPGFENQLAVRQSPATMEAQKEALIAMEQLNDPIKCQYQSDINKSPTICPVAENQFAKDDSRSSDEEQLRLTADGQVCTVKTPPELLSICPADNPNCNGSLEELTASNDKSYIIINKETGEIIDRGGSDILGKYAGNADIEIRMTDEGSSSQGKTFVIIDKETGEIIDRGGSDILGKYAQNDNVEIRMIDEDVLTPGKTFIVVDKETGQIIDRGGSEILGKYAQNAGIEIFDLGNLPNKENIFVAINTETGEIIESGNSDLTGKYAQSQNIEVFDLGNLPNKEKTYIVVDKETGEIIEQGGSEIFGKYAQSCDVNVIDQENGNIIEISGLIEGGIIENGKFAEDYPDNEISMTSTFVDENGNVIEISEDERELAIANAAAKATVRTYIFDEDGNFIEVDGDSNAQTNAPDFCPLDEDGNPQCGQEISLTSANDPSYCEPSIFRMTPDDPNYCEPSLFQNTAQDPDYCEPSIFDFLREEDHTCSPSILAFLHEEIHGCEPSVFDILFGTKPSCALEEGQTLELADFAGNSVEEKGFTESKGQSWTPLVAQTEETQDAVDRNLLCIVNRGPYDKLSPENIYRVRASIVGVTNANGTKGAGLLISDQFVLTSADLIIKDKNKYQLKTINGVELSGQAVRINVKKNTALILLDEKTMFTPLSLNLELPEIGTGGYMALGLLEDHEGGEGYLDDKGKVSGYRYSDDRGTEILVDTFVQSVTVGGALIDDKGTINGMAHAGKKTEDGPDLFIPIATAINSVGLEICGQINQAPKVPMAVIKPISTAIDSFTGSKEPLPMGKKGRK